MTNTILRIFKGSVKLNDCQFINHDYMSGYPICLSFSYERVEIIQWDNNE